MLISYLIKSVGLARYLQHTQHFCEADQSLKTLSTSQDTSLLVGMHSCQPYQRMILAGLGRKQVMNLGKTEKLFVKTGKNFNSR